MSLNTGSSVSKLSEADERTLVKYDALLAPGSGEHRVVGNAVNIHSISKHHKERAPTPAYLLKSTMLQRTNLLPAS